MKTAKIKYEYLILLSTCIIVTVVYFSPFLLAALRSFKPELRFTGDLQIACYPAFIQAGKYFSDWTYYGIDFFTANGSSSLFNRPNLPTYYLPQLLLQSIIKVTNNSDAAKLFTVLLWLNGLFAMLFTTLWLNRIMKLNIYPSLLGGAIFFSLIVYSYGQTSFFNVASTFPALMYCLSFSLLTKTNIQQKILLSLPLVVIITAGYLPIAVMGICVAAFASLALAKFTADEVPKYKDFVVVLAIGGLVIGGYLLTIVNAVHIVPAVGTGPLTEAVFFADMPLTFKSVLYIFLASAPNDIGEGPQLQLGLPIAVLIYVSYSHLFANGNSWKKNTSIICFVIFLLSILLGMGRVGGLPELFFYTVPGLGGMHGYQRYMLISVFFLVFGLILALSDLWGSDKPLNLKVPSIGVAASFLLVLLFPEFLIKNSISVPIFFAELFLSVLVLITLNLRSDNRFLLILIPILKWTPESRQ